MLVNYSQGCLAVVASLSTGAPCYNHTLQCSLYGIFMDSDSTVHFVLEEGDCVDMDGAIQIAEDLNRTTNLMKIQTWSGTNLDTLYYKKTKGPSVFEDTWLCREAPFIN